MAATVLFMEYSRFREGYDLRPSWLLLAGEAGEPVDELGLLHRPDLLVPDPALLVDDDRRRDQISRLEVLDDLLRREGHRIGHLVLFDERRRERPG